MEIKMKKIGILGAGQMGTGMAYLLGYYKDLPVKIWDRTPEIVKSIQEKRESPHLSGYNLPEKVRVFSEIEEVVKEVDLLVLAIPSFAVREVCQRIIAFRDSLLAILMISKGLEKETSKLPFQIVKELLGQENILHLTGIGYPKELKKEKEVTEGLAASKEELLREFGDLFETHFIKFEKTTDLLGAQLGGALKNVMVIGIGMATARERHPEIKQQLISKFIPLGVEEMVKLGKAMGAKEETFEGPAGRGDLEISANPLSRNFHLGQDLFEKGVKEVKRDLENNKKTVEGLLTAFAVHNLTERYGLNLPIIEAVYQVIYKGGDPKQSTQTLLSLIQ
jgi:glycerol-3-phosphate dehydrogenase (NAD(P)+)